MPGPLEGIKVLDWTQWQMGTVATAMLADLGAEVVHIENLATGDPGRILNAAVWTMDGGRNSYFETNNRGKKSLAINLVKPEGKEVIYRLVKAADVFAHNFRQGVPEKLGLGYDTLAGYNSMIVYAAASGFGAQGPESREPAFDLVGLARSGITSAVGSEDDPNLPSGGIADQMGAIMTSYGILAALLARERLGVGRKVDVSHLGSMMALQGLMIGIYLYTNPEPGVKPTRKQAANPLWNYYRCRDGGWITLGMLQPDRQWPAVCLALGIEHLADDPRYVTQDVRALNAESVIAVMDEVFLTRTAAEWMKELKTAGDIICTPVQTLRELPADPQVVANDYILETDHEVLGKVSVRGLPMALSKTPGRVRVEAPEFGQHTEEVLLEMGGYTWEEIADLKAKEVI